MDRVDVRGADDHEVHVLRRRAGAAVLALSEFPDELMDEDNYTRYFPIVGEWGHPVLVEQGAPLLKEIGDSPLRHEEITLDSLASLAAESQFVLRF